MEIRTSWGRSGGVHLVVGGPERGVAAVLEGFSVHVFVGEFFR